MSLPGVLHDYRRLGVIGRDEIAAAGLLVEMARRDGAAEPEPLAWLGICLAIRTVRDGHTCVDFNRIEDWAGGLDLGSTEGPAWPVEPGPWIAALEQAEPLVGCPGQRRPLLLDGTRLYLARSLAEEEAIAAALTRESGSRVRILLGGPGTGKTTKVASDLVERFSRLGLGEPRPRLALAAPTGKAAARMSEVLLARCTAAGATDDVKAAVTAEPARTVHKLLGYHPDRSDRFTYHAGNRLPYDLVIVDEASMLSSSLMHDLLAALGPRAEIMLVGDPDQLASVDAGTVLGDIASLIDPAGPGPGSAAEGLAGRIEVLTTVHRAKDAPTIQAVAGAIRRGDTGAVMEIVGSGEPDVAWVDPADKAAFERLVGEVVDHARRLGRAAAEGNADAAVATRAELQVLCGHREGSLGVAGWNGRVERRLGVAASGPWYTGRPVMATRNSRALRLSNGDIGVVLLSGNRKEAVFGRDPHLVRVPISRLEDITTVHALTIHKSQGSEYDHAVVVLPERPSRIVTRELLYTGITRAIRKVTLVGSAEVITAALARPIRRATGLAARLGRG